MARLRWNFAQRPKWAQPWGALCIVALLGCIHALWWRHDLMQRREHLAGQAQEASRRAAVRAHRIAAPPPVALDQVFAEMRYPWIDMLDSLQRVTQPSLDLFALEPDAGAIRRVQISGVADRAQDVFDLIAALQADPSWSSVQLISQTRIENAEMFRASDTASPSLPGALTRSVSFSLVAEWVRP
ncbi:UNVERIFIED_ORG: hypothetical protein ABIC54_000539 [Burkholderia sp. 1263]